MICLGHWRVTLVANDQSDQVMFDPFEEGDCQSAMQRRLDFRLRSGFAIQRLRSLPRLRVSRLISVHAGQHLCGRHEGDIQYA